ncbi:MAG: O-antigen ligase family protein [Verrucomicrobia bacterium]|nr:O-antigen ligase family protein [Verrucomicrobiota bacterium]
MTITKISSVNRVTNQSRLWFHGARTPGQFSDYRLFAWSQGPDGWALFLFIFGTMFLNGPNQQRLLGLLLCGVFGVMCCVRPAATLRRLFPAPPELVLYTAWVLWAGVTGPFVAVDIDAFWKGYQVLPQMLGLVWVVYGVLRLRKGAVNGVFLAMVCGGLVQVGALLSGLTASVEVSEGEQALGATDNPNTLGFMMVWTILCALVLWGLPGRARKWLRAGGILLLPFCGYVVVASASRKSLLGILFLLGFWAIFTSSARKTWVRVFWGGATIVLLLLVLTTALPFLIQHTVMGQRFQDFVEKGGGSLQTAAEENVRYWMYVEGLRMFSEHPICGVGIQNFGAHFWRRTYSHSDLIEPLATTGLAGFLLYQSFYFLILYRATRILMLTRDETVRYRLKMILIGTLVIMLIGCIHCPVRDFRRPFIAQFRTARLGFGLRCLRRQHLRP